jgi:radical SAM protein with 4Fe4S-binding SPASM domain
MEKSPYITVQDMSKIFSPHSKPALLGSLDIELTERCNNNCVHCCINLAANDLNAKRKELSAKRIKGILKEAASLGCMRVRFTGGEPLLREDFSELYIFARKLGLNVLVFTNATLITEEIADLFSRIPPREKIEISVYGMKKSSYEGVSRIKGSYARAFNGMKLLLKRKVPFVVKGAFLPQNKKDFNEFMAWGNKIPWMEGRDPSLSMHFDLRGRRDDPGKNDQIRSFRISEEQARVFFNIKLEEYLKEKKQFCSKFMHPSGKELFICGSALNSGCVDAYGFFQPCLMLRHPGTVYDLKKGSLKDALENFFPKLRKMTAKNSQYLKRCAKCFLKGLCEQCPAKSWGEHGTLDTPVEYLCKMAHHEARFLGMLEKDELAWEVKNWQQRIDRFVNS